MREPFQSSQRLLTLLYHLAGASGAYSMEYYHEAKAANGSQESVEVVQALGAQVLVDGLPESHYAPGEFARLATFLERKYGRFSPPSDAQLREWIEGLLEYEV